MAAKRTKYVAAGVLLVVMVAVGYLPALRAGYVWDDDDYVTKNPLLVEEDGLKRIWFSTDQPSQYFPLVYTSFRLEYAIWQLNPLGYHIINIILHAINALLVWRLLGKLGVAGAYVAAAIFALHPVQVESVAWITERKNLLMSLFGLLSLLVWMRFAERSVRSQRAWPYYVASVILYALALLSKTTACTLIAALLLLLWLKGIRIDRKRCLQIVPFIVLGLAMGALTIWWEHSHQGLHPTALGFNPLERILIASRALWFYLGKLIWPMDLSFSYRHWDINAQEPKQYVWLFLCLLIVGSMWCWRARLGKASIAAMLFFVATLLPILGFISLWTFYFTYVADHYQYLACIGPIALAVSFGYYIANRLGRWGKKAMMVAAGLILLALGGLSAEQCRLYKNSETLWRDTIAKNPDSWMAHNNLGNILKEQGKDDEAVEHFYEALQIKPDFAGAHYNLANMLQLKDEFEKAIGHYRRALEIRPNYSKAHSNLAVALQLQGKDDEAIEHYRRSLSIMGKSAQNHYNLAHALRAKGAIDEAIMHYRQSLQIKPNSHEVHYNLGITLIMAGEREGALRHFEKVRKLKPDHVLALNGMAWILATHTKEEIRDGDKAARLAERAAQLTGYKNAAILDTLAAAYATAGQFDQAMKTAEAAVALAKEGRLDDLAGEIGERLRLYRQNKPFREDIIEEN